MLIASFMSPLHAVIIAHGTITLPEPNIGSASTNPMPNAYSNGYDTFIPVSLNIYSPINEIMNDTNTNIASAFRYFPSTSIISFRCL